MPRRVLKIFSILLCFLLIFEQSGFAQVAGELDISGRILQLRNSLIQDKFRPLHLRYLSYDILNNNFKLLLDKGDSKVSTDPSNPSNPITQATQELLNYFFVGISLPNDTFWVNLRPDSPEQIIDADLAKTDIGKILLEADLQLKKDTAQFTSPETLEGKEYWEKLYKKAEEIFGTENVTIPTLTRPWIVPDEIIIRETQDNAYIYKATLKVMLESDYLNSTNSTSAANSSYRFKDERSKALNEYSSQLIRELIIPKLIKEVNIAKRYAPLRQVYYSLILAQWFKSRFYGKGGLYSWLIDKKNLNGLISKESWSKNTYFQAYQKSFKDGEYNIKTPVSTPFGQTIRSYFSGGIALIEMKIPPAFSSLAPGETIINDSTLTVGGRPVNTLVSASSLIDVSGSSNAETPFGVTFEKLILTSAESAGPSLSEPAAGSPITSSQAIQALNKADNILTHETNTKSAESARELLHQAEGLVTSAEAFPGILYEFGRGDRKREILYLRQRINAKREVIEFELRVKTMAEKYGRPFLDVNSFLAPNFEKGEPDELIGHATNFDALYKIVFESNGWMNGSEKDRIFVNYGGRGQAARVRVLNKPGLVPIVWDTRLLVSRGIKVNSDIGEATISVPVPLGAATARSKCYMWQTLLNILDARNEELSPERQKIIAHALGYNDYPSLAAALSTELNEVFKVSSISPKLTKPSSASPMEKKESASSAAGKSSDLSRREFLKKLALTGKGLALAGVAFSFFGCGGGVSYETTGKNEKDITLQGVEFSLKELQDAISRKFPKVTQEGLKASIHLSNGGELNEEKLPDSVKEVYRSLKAENILSPSASFVPVLFLKGVEDDWGMAIYGGLELIVVGYDYYKDSLPSQEAKDAWLAKMIAHEATHIIKPKEEPGLTPLEYEYFAQKASYEVAKNKAWKTDEDTVEGAKKVYEAFGILVSESKRQEVVDLFGIPVGDFIHLYYRGIVKPATEDKIYDPIVKITLFDTRNEEEKTVQVNIETGKIDLVVVPSAASPVVIKDKPASSAEENNYLKEVLRRQLIANNPATPAGENMATIDFEHTQRVVELANAVAKVLGADLEVVEKAALLHDIAKKPGLEALVKHHIEGARLAGEILKGRKSQEFIDKVQDAIMRHMGPLGKENDKGFMASIKDAYDKSSGENVNMPRPQSLEAIALKIADMLDLANGGVAKVVAKRQTEDVPDYFKADGQRETLRDSVKSALGSVEAAKKEIKDLTDTLVAMGVSKDVAVNIYNVSDLIGIRTKEFVDNLDWSKIPTHQEFSEAYNNNPLIPTTAEIVNFIQNGVAKSAGSPLEEQKEPVSSAVSNKGGIDLRALPIVTQPMGIQGLAPLSSGLVPLGRPQNALAGTDPKLDEEWREIQNMLNAGIIPSCERIKEYLQASCQSQDCSQRIDNMLACLADILRLEEERVCASELVLKEILVLLESDKPANEMQIALSRITVAPKEPKLIDTH